MQKAKKAEEKKDEKAIKEAEAAQKAADKAHQNHLTQTMIINRRLIKTFSLRPMKGVVSVLMIMPTMSVRILQQRSRSIKVKVVVGCGELSFDRKHLVVQGCQTSLRLL